MDRQAILLIESAKRTLPTKRVFRCKRWVSVYVDRKAADRLERVWWYLYKQGR